MQLHKTQKDFLKLKVVKKGARMGFPNPLPLPETILQARKERSSNLIRVATLGISLRMSIVLIELAGFFLFGSQALLLDSLSTLADAVSSILLILSIKLAERPPDTNHPFGHGRYEPLAGLQLGIFLSVTGFGLLLKQVFGLFNPVAAAPLDTRVWLFALVAVILLELSFRKIQAIARKEKSEALMAEAVHFRIDSCNSFLALVALGVAALFPQISWICDHIGALVIALLMCGMGLFAAKKNLNQILDRIPEKELFMRVENAAKKVEGVLDTEKIRIKHYGPDAHVDIDIEVDPHLSVEVAHEISQKVRLAIQTDWPQVREVMVHIEPYFANDHKDRLL